MKCFAGCGAGRLCQNCLSLGTCPRPGRGTSCRTRLQAGLWEGPGDAGGSWWEFPSSGCVVSMPAEAGECGGAEAQCAHQTTSVTRFPSATFGRAACSQRMHPVVPEQQSKEQPAPVAASSKEKWDTSCQLGHNSFVCIFIYASSLTLHARSFKNIYG